jgi:hypothetical protein
MVQTRYGALRTIAAILKVLAWIVGVGCALGFVVALLWAAVKLDAEALLVGLMLLLYAVLGFIYLYACGEGIHVILDIEANTRRAGDMLERFTRQPGSPEA